MDMRYSQKRCPLLKNEKVMYCRNYPIRKMLPVERVFENENLCLKESHKGCPLYDASKVDSKGDSRICPFVEFETMSFCQAFPLKKIAANELITSPCSSDRYEDCAVFRRMTGKVGGRKPINHRGFTFDSSKDYFENHMWLERKNGSALLGLDDFGQFIIGEVNEMEVRDEGERVSKDDWIFRLRVAEGRFEFMSPVEGRVVEVNESLKYVPHMINLDPYGCWIAKIRIEGKVNAMGVEEAKRVLDIHIEKMLNLVQGKIGPTMADGGELSRDARKRIKDRGLVLKLIREILRGKEV